MSSVFSSVVIIRSPGHDSIRKTGAFREVVHGNFEFITIRIGGIYIHTSQFTFAYFNSGGSYDGNNRRSIDVFDSNADGIAVRKRWLSKVSDSEYDSIVYSLLVVGRFPAE